MLGVTTYITTDLAAIPLLWVVPLTLYLLSFVIAFARVPPWVHETMVRALPPLILVLIFLMISGTPPLFWRLWMTILLHLAVLFVVAMVCHGELGRDRPSPEHLTEFYLWISLGGVLGGLFNAVLAPLFFNTVEEYPLALTGASLLLPRLAAEKRTLWGRRLDLLVPLALGVLTIGLISGLLVLHLHVDRLGPIFNLESGQVIDSFKRVLRFDLQRLDIFLRYGVPVVLCYLFVERPVRFGLCVGAVLLASALCTRMDKNVLFRERSFFGILKVELRGGYHSLVHGTTLHGMQSGDPINRREPLTYYHRTGPIGHVFELIKAKKGSQHVAVVGLGTGTLASYGDPGCSVTFYEIDPSVERIARDPLYFTYLQDCVARGGSCNVILGDARLKLETAPDHEYGLIVVDAFSSDAIPVHLLTSEALHLYLAKLAPDGILAFHLSNRHLDLEPVLANLADRIGLVGRSRLDGANEAIGKSASHWLVLARRPGDLGELSADQRWRELSVRPG